MRRLERQLGRLLDRNQRAAGRYVIDFVPDPTQSAGVRLDWRACPEWDDWARWSEGCDVLRTIVLDWSPQGSVAHVHPLTDVLVCFLAYVLWKRPEQWQPRAGLGQSPRTIFDEVRRIQSPDVVLPTEDGRELRLRCIVRPDTAPAALLGRLGIDLPQRLRVPPPVARIANVWWRLSA